MKRVFGALVIAMLLAGCVTDEDEARNTLDESGYVNVSTGDVSIMGCGHGDKYGREFTATNPNGRRVNGVVCCGIWKSCTVRF